MTLCVGITGGIGSGKSTFANFLSRHGQWPLIDADAISRSLTAAGGAAIPNIIQNFSSEYVFPDGSLNREKMRQLVFNDISMKIKLESIIHPLIKKEIKKNIAKHNDNCEIILVEIPLLLEKKYWQKLFHKIIIIDCKKITQIKRIQKRNKLPSNEAKKIIDSQLNRSFRQQAADYIIMNDSKTSLAALQILAKLIASNLLNASKH